MIHNADKIRLDRLQSIHDHLAKGELSVDRFYFGAFRIRAHPLRQVVFKREGVSIETVDCGTLGCVIGEFPAIFPEWESVEASELGGDAFPVCHDGDVYGRYQDRVARFLGLTPLQALHLFWPGAQTVSEYGGRWLRAMSPKEDVADNLAQFIFLVEQTLADKVAA